MAKYHLAWAGVYWLAWLFVGFLPYELWMAWHDPDYTLSDQFRALEGITQKTRFEPWAWTLPHWVLAIALAILFIWLWGHLVFDIWG